MTKMKKKNRSWTFDNMENLDPGLLTIWKEHSRVN